MDNRVQVLVGDNDDQWEVHFSRDVYRETGISPFLTSSITVQVDADTTEVSLYGWARPGSIEEHAERTLFEACKVDIEAGVMARLDRHLDYAPAPAFA